MTRKERDEAKERFFLDQFLKKLGIPPRNIERLDPPDPDFSIELNGRRIGVELTEIFIQHERPQPSPHNPKGLMLQEIHELTNKIVSESREIYFQRAANPLVKVDIVFANLQFGRKERDEIARLIARQVELMVSEDPLIRHWRPDVPPEEWNYIYDAISSIYVDKVPKAPDGPEMRFARWKSPSQSVGLVSTLTVEGLQERINDKIKKLQNYKRNIDETWLLIVADRTRSSQMLQRPFDIQIDRITTPFDKTFYYCYGIDEPILELNRTHN